MFYFAHCPGQSAPNNFVVMNLDRDGLSILPGAQLKKIPHIRSIRGSTLPATHDVSIARTLPHDQAKVTVLRHDHGCFDRILAMANEACINRANRTWNPHIFLNPKIISGASILAEPHQGHLSRTQLHSVAAEYWLETCILE